MVQPLILLHSGTKWAVHTLEKADCISKVHPSVSFGRLCSDVDEALQPGVIHVSQQLLCGVATLHTCLAHLGTVGRSRWCGGRLMCFFVLFFLSAIRMYAFFLHRKLLNFLLTPSCGGSGVGWGGRVTAFIFLLQVKKKKHNINAISWCRATVKYDISSKTKAVIYTF